MMIAQTKTREPGGSLVIYNLNDAAEANLEVEVHATAEGEDVNGLILFVPAVALSVISRHLNRNQYVKDRSPLCGDVNGKPIGEKIL